ncbi:type II secretion system protein [Herbaspirillum sp. RV1423]|uniref:type II secretion system protein n=1 Tax=Herbaspirillum sp. RV1423 TaxID=1443993 RepID=UPI0004BC4466|nr:prepilin-type N-terminal cleavage/methylation domain-containing protein [Herbaspirillum sp. RV1423]
MTFYDRRKGFTLIELLVVMAIIATLLSLAAPRYIGNVDKAKESVLRENLSTLRDVIDKFYGDTGKYPQTLDDLVSHKYLRKIPLDPMTDSNRTWMIVAPENSDLGGVFDVRSGSSSRARDGTLYRDW